MIRFENYRKAYGKTEIVAIPQLELAHGIYWLRGENGTGKTTMIKSVAGLIPFDGSMSVAGANIKSNRVAFTSIVNYAEAEPQYPEFLTGSDLIRLYSETKKAPQAQVTALSARLGITGYVDNKTATYSSGMAKKLSIVLGFLGQPKLILLDEPLITLDTNSVSILQDMIQEYHAKGVSFIITSHQEIAIAGKPISRIYLKDKTLVAG